MTLILPFRNLAKASKNLGPQDATYFMFFWCSDIGDGSYVFGKYMGLRFNASCMDVSVARTSAHFVPTAV